MQISKPSILRIKPNALHKLGKYLRKSKMDKIAIFWGEGIKDIFYDNIHISLESSEINVVYEETVSDNEIEKLFESSFSLPSNVEAVVAIGGGKVIDYCKYMAYIKHLPIMSIPTSISNDGFASPMSSIYVKGKRKSLQAKIPEAVIVDTKVVKESPARFIYSGIGDLVSNITAIYDWKLAVKQVDGAINDFAALVSENAVENFMNYQNKDIKDIELIRLISGSLVMNGISMEISQSSRPSSGSEHLISHAYDLYAKNPTLHGIQVGVATYCVSYVQQNTQFENIKKVFEETGFFKFVEENPIDKEDFIKAVDMAKNMKENFYTILSKEGSVEKIKKFIEEDEWCKKIIR